MIEAGRFSSYSLPKLKALSMDRKMEIFLHLEGGLKFPESTWFYEEVIGIGEEHNLNENSKLEFYRRLCEEDLYYFTKYILRKSKLRPQPNRAMTEKAMIRHTPDLQERKLICEPRGTFKTTIFSMAYPIWKIIKDRNISILIDSETDHQAKSIFLAVKEEFESNLLLIKLWGEMVSGRWNETMLFVKGRTNARRDPTLFHTGVDCSINGFHPNIAILDDPCSENNVQTAASRDKVHEHYKLLTPLVEKDGEIIVVMTRWHFDDLATRILKTERSFL